MDDDILLQVENLTKHFPIEKGFFRRTVGQVQAVDGISLFIRKGETVGLVGESGCGKTTASRTILRLLEPTSGRVTLRTSALSGAEESVELFKLGAAQMKAVRRDLAMIFQDPVNSLNPRMMVYDIITEPLAIQNQLDDVSVDYVEELVRQVGMPVESLYRYPHEFSGGQRQRIGIARALSLRPRLILADEPVSALDVSIQAQTLNLLRRIQQETGIAFLFVAHDLSVVQHISDRIAVMYLGKIVELSDSVTLYAKPKHPYTEALMGAVSRPDPELKSSRRILRGELPDPSNPPKGCRFHTRCPYAKDVCRETEPEFQEVEPGRYAACHFANDLDLKGV